MILHEYIINKLAPQFSRILVNRSTPGKVLKGDFNHNLSVNYRKFVNGTLKLIFKSRRSTIENWNFWLNVVHKNFVDDLIFSKESKIQDFFPPDTIERIKKGRDGQLIGKLLTAEIILRLMKTGWKRFW
jgi:hypothetical protein